MVDVGGGGVVGSEVPAEGGAMGGCALGEPLVGSGWRGNGVGVYNG